MRQRVNCLTCNGTGRCTWSGNPIAPISELHECATCGGKGYTMVGYDDPPARRSRGGNAPPRAHGSQPSQQKASLEGLLGLAIAGAAAWITYRSGAKYEWYVWLIGFGVIWVVATAFFAWARWLTSLIRFILVAGIIVLIIWGGWLMFKDSKLAGNASAPTAATLDAP